MTIWFDRDVAQMSVFLINTPSDSNKDGAQDTSREMLLQEATCSLNERPQSVSRSILMSSGRPVSPFTTELLLHLRTHSTVPHLSQGCLAVSNFPQSQDLIN